MSTAIVDTVIGKDIEAYGDEIYDGILSTDIAPVTSPEFILGNTNAGVEIKLRAKTGFTLAQAGTITMKLLTAIESGGTFTEYGSQVVTVGATGGTVYAVGDVIGVGIVPAVEMVDQIHSKVELSSSADLSANSVVAYIRPVRT